MSPVNPHHLYNSSAPFLFVYRNTYRIGYPPNSKRGLQRQSSSRVRMPSFPTLRGLVDVYILIHQPHLGTTD